MAFNLFFSYVKYILIAVDVYFHFEMPRKDHINSTFLVSGIQNVGMYGF